MVCACVSQKPLGFGHRKMKLVAVLVCVAIILGTGAVLARVIDSPTNQPHSDRELRLVHVVFRHGERTPADTYPNDIYFNYTFHPYGWGQITNPGRKNMYASGQFLRNRYNEFLGDLYIPAKVYAQSTHPDRAHMSCALVLAGLWPPEGTDLEWNYELNWSPIPIRSQPLEEDTLLLARKNCSRYFEELDNIFKLPDVQNILSQNANLFKELTEITGLDIKTPDDVQSLYSTLKAEDDFELELPEWTNMYYPDKLVPLTETSFILNAYNDELKRLKGGPLLKKLISDWSAKAAGTLSPKDRKIFVYSGHDSTVSNLLLALNVWDCQIPRYGITAMFELYENVKTKEYSVEIYLRNTTKTEPYKLQIPGCDHLCPLDTLIELTKKVVPVDWTEECKAKDPNYMPPKPGGP